MPSSNPLVLLAGDHFVLPELLRDAVRAEAADAVRFREITLEWPYVPFGPVAEVIEASGTEEQLIEALSGVSVCVTQMAPFTERVLEAAGDLRLVCVGRGGPVNVNLAAATERGVAVCYAPGRNAAATAEHSVALILAAARGVPDLHTELRAGRWRSDYYAYDNCGFELDGATVGLVGYGAIGGRVARAMSALGATILVYDPYVSADSLDGPVELVTLEELLGRADVVSLHARLTPETDSMIGRAQIQAMRPGSVLVNCARGGLLDHEALCDALDSGHLRAAALDVFDLEPLPLGSRILTTPRLVLTPHVAGASRQVARKAATITAAEVGRFLRGEPLAHCANPAVLAEGRVRRG